MQSLDKLRKWDMGVDLQKKKKGQHLLGGTYYVNFGPKMSANVQVNSW